MVTWFIPVILAGILLVSSRPALGAESVSRISPSFKEFSQFDNGLTLKIMILLLELSVVLIAAKLLGALAERFNIPGVLGELAAGVVVGPFALGALLAIPIHGLWVPLFPKPIFDAVKNQMEWPISDGFWFIAQLASIVLLFMAGLHTNLKQFLRYLGPASIIAIGGVVLPFFFGAFTTSYFTGHAWYMPDCLFMGAIMVATSVGITARVLSDLRKLDTPEGVTILGAAVVDDVLGILVLAVVASICQSERGGGNIAVGEILLLTLKAFGFWLGLTFIGMILANPIERLFNRINYAGARLGLGLALALFCAGLAEMFGLAFIIGAYSIGLALSKTKMAHQLIEDLTPINDFIVPIFFAAMGMLVNFRAMSEALVFGLVICVLATIGKAIGCGVPALFTGFNLKGATRIGIGMLPRGEVALILAGVGLAGNYISQSNFGVAILMTLVTTIIAPLLLVPAFKSPLSGVRHELPAPAPSEEVSFSVSVTPAMAGLLTQLLLSQSQQEGYQIKLDDAEQGIYLLQKEGKYISLRHKSGNITIDTEGMQADELNRLIDQVDRTVIDTMNKFQRSA